MLQPKRTKFRKQHKGRNRGLALRGSTVAFGTYGLIGVKVWIFKGEVFDKPEVIPAEPAHAKTAKAT